MGWGIISSFVNYINPDLYSFGAMTNACYSFRRKRERRNSLMMMMMKRMIKKSMMRKTHSQGRMVLVRWIDEKGGG